MKYRGTSHTQRVQHPSLLYATDGSLILEIDNPLLKIKRDDTYSDKNIYDIIMIDEAHEHKINMDMLLTLLKLPIAYNNSVRLVILSATMDEDEPRYRRYYRDVNDNLKYPIDNWIQKHALDRINVDRRFHISPPGMGTRFKVQETYVPDGNIVDTILDIVRSSSDGDILAFQPGKGEILETIKGLNSQLPSDVIALPYYGELSKEAREFIEKITERLKNLRISKSDNFSGTTDFTTGTNRYKRAVIVATNAAEASITIPSLKYVVDTGNQKTSIYDYKKKGTKLIKMDISESSRIQRKGRVGRTSSGTVYYLYDKGKMENNKIACEISMSDLYSEIFHKLRTDVNEKELISRENDLNCFRTKMDKNYVTKNFDETGVSKMIIQQYFNGDDFVHYFGNKKSYDYDNYFPLAKYYSTGFDSVSLTDNNGTFYLVHPNEFQLKRNINGDIVGILESNIGISDLVFTKTGKYKGRISSKKITKIVSEKVPF
jgi:hypothetical protein